MNEQTLLLALQIVLGILVTVGLKWTANIRQELIEMRAAAGADHAELVSLRTLQDSEKQFSEYNQVATNERLGKVSAETSDLKLRVERLSAVVRVCHHCPHPNNVAGDGKF